MATPDMPGRIRGLLPPSWFPPGATPVLDALLAGLGSPITFAYNLYSFVTAQARLSTSVGAFLDLFALDFFGANLPRRAGETDDSYLPRIQSELQRDRVTRAGIAKALTDLTGSAPTLIEPWNTGDCASVGVSFGAGIGFPVGSLSLPNQVFVTVHTPGYSGVPNVAGIGTGGGGVGVGALTPIGSTRSGGVSNAEIYATIVRNTAAGVRAWTRIV
jgi:hypothetical protein